MQQLSILDLEERPDERVCVYAGYSFGLIGHARSCGFERWLTGVVVTSRWAERCAQELRLDDEGVGPQKAWEEDAPDGDPLYSRYEAPSLSERVIVDNGAYPAWVRGEELSLGEQLDGIHAALEHIPHAEWIIAPDVVANARRTVARIDACSLELQSYGLDRLLLPVQEGMDVDWVVERAAAWDCGIFVGGATWRFKLDALRQLRGRNVRWIHVGRASGRAELHACAQHGADAVDSSSFLRAQHHNVGKRAQYAAALSEHAWPRQTPIEDGHAPRMACRREDPLAPFYYDYYHDQEAGE